METKDTFRDLQFDGRPSGYRDFRRKTILAVAGQENKFSHLAGPRLLQRLQGEAWRATEHLRAADLRKPKGWLEVIHALDLHYRFLPETELHEAVEEFLFSMKRRPGEGATSFSSRFRTQLDRVQTLIAQEREQTRSKKRRGKRKGRKPTADVPPGFSSSLEESDGDAPSQTEAEAAQPTENETAGEAHVSAEERASREDAPSVHTVQSQAASSHGSKRKSEHGLSDVQRRVQS